MMAAVPRPRHPNHRPVATLPVELRRTSVPTPARDWIRRVTGSGVERTRRLPGASSAAIHRIALADGRSLVLRRYVWPGFLADEPEAPGREVAALVHANRHGLPVPEVVSADPTGTEVGDGVPALLMTLLPGQPLAAPDPHRLAEVAAAVHAVDADDLGHEYFPWYETEMMRPPARTTRPELWEEAIGIWRQRVPTHRARFIHRDYHPGNVLWSRGRATGVVDWANACRGPVGCDVATCRANLVEWAGDEVAAAFVSAYCSLTGEELHPFWELARVLEHGPEHWTEPNLVRSEPRLEQLVAELR